MKIVFDIIFGMLLPYAVLPALLIATIVKMRSLKLTLGLIVLAIAAFCYGFAMGIQIEKRENRIQQHKAEMEARHESNSVANQAVTIGEQATSHPQH
jgi:hypothetical protein